MEKILQFFAVFLLYFFMLFTLANSLISLPTNALNFIVSVFFLCVVLLLTQITIKKLSV